MAIIEEWHGLTPAFSPGRKPVRSDQTFARANRIRGSRQWRSDRPATRLTRRAAPVRRRRVVPPTLVVAKPEINPERLPSAPPEFVEPMKATLVENLPRGEERVYEIKFD